MSKILITGAAGFIGYFLAQKLSDNTDNKIVIIDNFIRGKKDKEFESLIAKSNVKFIQADLTDNTVLNNLEKDFDYIYHLAAIIGVKNVMQNPDKTLFVNTVSTFNLLEFAKTMKDLKSFYFSSTSEIYSGTLKHFGIDVPTKEDVLLTIEDIKSERTTYALSKMVGESACFNYARKFNIPIIIGRYHNVYGPRMGFEHVIPELMKKISSNKILELHSPTHTRAFCYVDDAVNFTIKLCENTQAHNEIYHIGNPNEEISVLDISKKIATVIDKNIEIKELPDTPGSTSRRCPNTDKITSLTKYSPEINLEKGLRLTYNWYKDKLGV